MEIKYNEVGLVPAIAQDALTGKVLMMAWMNKEALELTKTSGYATYFSRSRNELWKKGETSGNLQKVVKIQLDCDGDSILVQVLQTGGACHTGEYTCFHNDILDGDMPATSNVLGEVYAVILDRVKNPKEGSYTNYLFEKGIDKMCKKIGEESAEVIIAAKNGSRDEVRYEASDLLYHLLVVLVEQGVALEDLWQELTHRR